MSDLLTHSIARSVWHGWGDPALATPVPDHAWAYLERTLGITRRAQPHLPVALEDVALPPSRLTAEDLAALAEALGAEHVATDRATRIDHAAGKSYVDLRRLRDGDASHAPDAVAFPGNVADVAELLRVCRARHLAVVPFGGGTSVVGGVTADVVGEAWPGADPAAFGGVIAVDLRRMASMTEIDPVSRTATFEPGMRGPEVEAALRPHGFTLGHYPQSHQEATIGGYVATRSAGQASTGYGRIDELVKGATLVTPEGTLALDHRAPASAAGPRLLDLVVGSEGAFGIITSATLAVAPMPAATAYAAVAFPDFASAAMGLRRLAQELGHGIIPDVTRVSDPDETRVSLALAGRAGGGLTAYLAARRVPQPCLAILLWHGDSKAAVDARRGTCLSLLRECGAVRLPSAVAKAWEHGRFSGPYLRDELMGHGVLVETLETATSWRDLTRLHTAVREAITSALADQGTPGVVQCHISHVYAVGASLYFTVVAPEAAGGEGGEGGEGDECGGGGGGGLRDRGGAGDGDRAPRSEMAPIEQWQRVKAAATAAILANGGTVTHHHAIGRDHRDALPAEVGELGVRVLAAVKATLDPTGILNPGVLIRPADHRVLAMSDVAVTTARESGGSSVLSRGAQ